MNQALTHSSWWRERSRGADSAAELPPPDNERLEFLGDAALGLRVCERLLERYPASSEGELSRLRSWIVSARNLARAADGIGLGRFLRLGRAEEGIGGRGKQRILANAMEALIAAVHLDGGYAAAAELIDRHVLGSSFEQLSLEQLHEFAYKSALQEWAHAAGRPAPVYRVSSATGPDHAKRFTVELELAGVYRGTGRGGSKKSAEQAAAEQALAFLGLLPGG